MYILSYALSCMYKYAMGGKNMQEYWAARERLAQCQDNFELAEPEWVECAILELKAASLAIGLRIKEQVLVPGAKWEYHHTLPIHQKHYTILTNTHKSPK
jgi:hypothetical protein